VVEMAEAMKAAGERRVEQEPKRCRLLAPGAALTEALL
jgi:hypothetical protein